MTSLTYIEPMSWMGLLLSPTKYYYCMGETLALFLSLSLLLTYKYCKDGTRALVTNDIVPRQKPIHPTRRNRTNLG